MISDFIFSEHVIKDQNGNHGGETNRRNTHNNIALYADYFNTFPLPTKTYWILNQNNIRYHMIVLYN